MARKEKDIVWFGMKVSPEEKEKIKDLAELYNLSQKEVVMNLVEDRIQSFQVKGRDEVREDVIKYAGVFDGTEDLSENKDHLEGYGRSSLT